MKSLQGSSNGNGNGNGVGAAVCPFAKMASDVCATARKKQLGEEQEHENHHEDHHNHDDAHHSQQQQPGAACDSSASTSTSSWEPDSQYEEDLAIMTQKCPVFQQQQQQQQQQKIASGDDTAAPRAISFSFSCPFKDQQVTAAAAAATAQNSTSAIDNADVVLRETLLKIPPSHYDMGEFVRVMEGFHHRVAIAASSDHDSTTTTKLLPKKCPVPNEIKNKISFRQALESRSLAAIIARLAEEHDKQQQQEQADAAATADAAAVPSQELDENKALHSVVEEDPHVVASATPITPTPSAAATTTTTNTTTSSSSSSLSHELKAGTAISHQAAENVHFVRNFIRGQIDRNLYGKLVTSLFHVYTALEMELDLYAPQHFASCHFPEQLKRVPALQADVDFWHGGSNSTTTLPPMSPATRDYVNRIHDIARTNPLLLLAHSYTRYLGDLSGGKILARVARRALHLDKKPSNPAAPVDGLYFYHFDKIASDKKFKDQYRQSLDDLSHLSSHEISQLVAEANVAFLLNMRIFEELDVAANVPGATVRPLQEALDYAATAAAATAAATHQDEEEQECPFLKQQQPKKGPATSTAITAATTTHGGGGRCPWPFVVFHDPIQFVCDWQTMVLVIFIGLAMIWQKQAAITT